MMDLTKYLSYIKPKHKIGLSIFVFLALMSSIIANENHLFGKDKNGIGFNVEKTNAAWGVPALIPYSYDTIDRNNRAVGPFDTQRISSLYYRHWLGTDNLGRDVLAGILTGFSIAFKIGFLTLILSFIVGTVLAFFAGYYGDNDFILNKLDFSIWLPISLVVWFYSYYLNGFSSFVLFILPVIALIYIYERREIKHGRTISLPLDMLVMKMIELLNSLPGIFLILIFLSLFKEASIWNIVLIIVILRWPVICRHLRAEIMSIKSEEYIMSARALGLKDRLIFLRHILPNAIGPVFTVLAFGFSSAVLIESTLSFLGLGLPVDQVSWGSLIKESRNNLNAWWLALFPGLMIYFTISLFNGLGNDLNAIVRKR